MSKQTDRPPSPVLDCVRLGYAGECHKHYLLELLMKQANQRGPSATEPNIGLTVSRDTVLFMKENGPNKELQRPLIFTDPPY